jgi:signal transduction histidine kinase
MFISVSFSLIIYKGITGEIDRFSQNQRLRIERRFEENKYFPKPPEIRFVDPDLVEEMKNRLALILVIINSGIFFIVGSLSYFLAGKTLRPIQEMVEEQIRFISDASHVFRTQLTALKSSLEVNLRDKNLTVIDAIKVMNESVEDVNNLQKLSDSLLQLAQYEKPKINNHFEKNSLKKIINESLQNIEALAKNKNITIKSIIVDGSLGGDKYGLVDLFVILLDNAIKYSKEGSVISIKTKKTKNSIIVSIIDKGIGIGEKDIPHIFNGFIDLTKQDQKRALMVMVWVYRSLKK